MTFRLWCGAIGLGMAGSTMAESTDVIPARYPISRYEETWNRASFALETPPQNAGNDVSFARDWVIVGVTTIRGVDAVLLSNRKNKDLIRLAKGEEVNGLKLLSVAQNPDPAQVKAVLQQGAETSQIGYDLSHSPTPAPPDPGNGQVTAGTSLGAPGDTPTAAKNAYADRMPGDVENITMTDPTKPGPPATRPKGSRQLVIPDHIRPKPGSAANNPPK